MNLSRVPRVNLEDIVQDMLCDLSTKAEHLYSKYKEVLDELMYCIDEDEATEIVKNFQPYGEVFSKEKVKDIVHRMNIPEKQYMDYYLCMNMFYNDFKHYADMKRLEPQEFCYEMSKLFIEDEDGPDYKVSKYFDMWKE